MSRIPSRRPDLLGIKLKYIRENLTHGSGRGLTQELMAEMLRQVFIKEFADEYNELNREYVSGFERGTRIVPPIVLLAYAFLANVYVEVLIDDRLIFPKHALLPYKRKYKGVRIEKNVKTIKSKGKSR